MWALVMSKGTGYSSQIWRTRSYFPKDEIKKGWDSGRKITSLTYDDGMWVLVMSEGTGYSSQLWKTRSYFPEDEIKKGWNSGRKISFIYYGLKPIK